MFIGVPEGCTLSPTLFAHYLADLDNYLTAISTTLGNTTINYLEFADNIAIIARSEEELRINLKGLENFCQAKKMKINVQKTKIMIV